MVEYGPIKNLQEVDNFILHVDLKDHSPAASQSRQGVTFSALQEACLPAITCQPACKAFLRIITSRTLDGSNHPEITSGLSIRPSHHYSATTPKACARHSFSTTPLHSPPHIATATPNQRCNGPMGSIDHWINGWKNLE